MMEVISDRDWLYSPRTVENIIQSDMAYCRFYILNILNMLFKAEPNHFMFVYNS